MAARKKTLRIGNIVNKTALRVVSGIGVGLSAGFAGLAAVPAHAATNCPTPSVLIAPGICEVVFSSSGTFTAPAGVTKLTAVVVGGGGGAYAFNSNTYGAGAGQVLYTEAIALTGSSDVVVGAGGTSVSVPPTSGEPSSIGSSAQASGGGGSPRNLFIGGTSGNGNVGFALTSGGGGGGGARTAATSSGVGTGYKLSEIPGVDSSLWPASSDVAIDSTVGMGGLGNVASPAIVDPPYGFGGGLGRLDGYSGVVIVRFAPIAEVLAVTAGASGINFFVPAVFIFAGASLLAFATLLKARRTEA